MDQTEISRIEREIIEKNRILSSLKKNEQHNKKEKIEKIKEELDKLLLTYIRNFNYTNLRIEHVNKDPQ